MSARWHILRGAGTVTLARHMPPRFDFSVSTTLAYGHPDRLVHQIRQDLWRALQRVRGFSPVVRLEEVEGGWMVTAGGRASHPVSARDHARAQAVLDNPRNQRRWQNFAGQREQS